MDTLRKPGGAIEKRVLDCNPQDEIAGRKPGRGQWRKRKKLGRSQNSGKQIILDGDALSTPYVPVGTKGN